MIPSFKDKIMGVILGGTSEEREVSIRSGENVYAALNSLGYHVKKVDPKYDPDLLTPFDIAFIALHGKGGEDGTIQLELEKRHIPYTGSRIEASKIGIDKAKTKTLLQKKGLLTPDFQMIKKKSDIKKIDFSISHIVKPNEGGSSIGVYVVRSLEESCLAMEPFLAKGIPMLIETYIQGKEITVSILEDKQKGYAELPILELVPKSGLYDYDAKYTPGKTQFILPAKLSKDMAEHCQYIAMETHKLIGAHGMSRVDMIVHPENGPYILEINTIPGFTDLSDLPAQSRHAGITFEQLVEMILNTAL
ncbi:MAG: D-alanine--D-alanine ligase [Candidatus Margulisbacteria bacterium]|nr:D-alanine--D-alanine ligase [Candidatus Margulisiibacteriota bacterium]